MRSSKLIFLVILFTSNHITSYELYLICKSEYQEMETQVFLSDQTDSWMIVPESLKSNAAKESKRPIKNFNITEDNITGYYRYDFIERRSFSINRKTGSISYKGHRGTFSGMCEKYDQINMENKF